MPALIPASEIVQADAIGRQLAEWRAADAGRVREILARARELKGLPSGEVLELLAIQSPELVEELFATARWVKNEIYGNRLVLFAPLYVSNVCHNDCSYCAFQVSNRAIARRVLDQSEVKAETETLVDQGHKRILLVSGETHGKGELEYILDCLDTIYSVKTARGNIRRVNVNIAPLSLPQFRELKEHKIGTYQLFQETYHEPTYRAVHPSGPKADYENRLATTGRALEAGISDVGVGVLFGLHDFRFEVLALLNHIKHLEATCGVGPHTISVPRIEPATGSALSVAPPAPVGDEDFQKIIAVLRLAVPYTGMILSTRESAAMRRRAFELGISQISAGSRTDPGGYGLDGAKEDGQFSLGDTRSLLEVLKDVVGAGHVPSFCTGCYRLGRVGKDFMDLAKPGLIKQHCLPNAMLTFHEYLQDFGDAELRGAGGKLIESMLSGEIADEGLRVAVAQRLKRIGEGSRDLFF